MSNVYNAINQLNNSVESFESNVNVHVKNVDTSTRKIQETAEGVYEKVNKFRTDIMHGEEKQIAHENIMRIDQIIKEKFGNYDEIRKTIIGVVRDFDINLVRNSTIEELSEELWITSSRYWLSYALLAVTAWVNDYPDVAKNALSESSRKDNIKTSLFFCLLNLRFDRIETAREWFKVYCRTLNPKMLNQEAAVMIQGFMNGLFGKDKQLEHEVIETINHWIKIISEDAVLCQSLVADYENYFEKFNMKAEFNYEMIQNYCQNSDEIKRSFTDVTKYDSLIQLIEDLNVEAVPHTDENYKSRVDAVLTTLITNYDAEERELKDEQAYYKLVINNEGNTDIAEDQYEEMKKLQNESFNIGKQMVDWVVYDDNTETDVSVRKFGLQSTKAWFQTALENWTIKVRERCPLQYKFAIDEWTGTSNGRDLDEQRTSLKNFFENNKFRMICINTINIALLIVFFISLIITVVSIGICANSGFTPALIVGIILMLGSAGIIAWRIKDGQKKFQLRVDTAVKNLESTMAQIVEFQRYFTENIRKKDDVIAKLSFI
ncbi:MAG: hypothetical protein E7500_02315 [Ruminococcus sp.]|nr:hypothetical protein [Ruminococcus sp.]